MSHRRRVAPVTTTTGIGSFRREVLTSEALSWMWMISSAAAWYPAARNFVASMNL